MNVDPNQPKVSNFDKAINYISKGTEIGKKVIAQDDRMKSLLEAPRKGENLSIGAKALNLVYLGMIALPALGSYKATDSIIKHFKQKDIDNNKAAKTNIEKDLKLLFKEKISLQLQMGNIASQHGDAIKESYTQSPKQETTKDFLKARENYIKLNLNLNQIDKDINIKLKKLDNVNEKLGVSVVTRSKENLIMRMQAFEDVSASEFLNADGSVDLDLDESKKNKLILARDRIKDEFITANEQTVNDYNRVLELRNTTDNRLTQGFLIRNT